MLTAVSVRPNLCSPSSGGAISATGYSFEPCSAGARGTMIGEKGKLRKALPTYICKPAVLTVINSRAQNNEVFPTGKMSFTEDCNNLLHYVQQSFYPTSVCFSASLSYTAVLHCHRIEIQIF